jgi:hypothetical protein
MPERHEHNTTKVEDMLQAFGSGQFISGTSDATPDTESVHAHDLGRVPRGYIIVSKDKAGDFYDSDGHDADELKIKNTVTAVTFLAWVF